MCNRTCWQKAFILSCLFHLVLLSGLGYISIGLLNASELEECLEMELMNEMLAVAPQMQEQTPSAISPQAEVPMPNKSLVTPQLVQQVIPQVSSETALRTMDTTTTPTVASEMSEIGAISTSISSGGETTESGSASNVGGASSGATGTSQATRVEKHTISPPRILEKIEPNYPEQARRDGVQGTVAVKMEILENGHSGEATVKHSSGNSLLDTAALNTVKKWRFIPARDEQSGEALRCYTVLSVAFQLN